jgi:superfamily II DNA or RNA helicase
MNELIARIERKEKLQLKIVSKNKDYLSAIKSHFTEKVEGYQFIPSYRSGFWNGEVCMIRDSGTFPYGLLIDLIKIHKDNFPNLKLDIDHNVKKIFNGEYLNPKYNLSLQPYPYQKDCIEASLRHTKGIIKSATASGKSLIIAYIIKTLLENNLVEKNLIVVPNQTLVEQFYSDLMEYGIDKKRLGRVYVGHKDWSRDIVISTWQSLSRNHKRLNLYDSIIIDECHLSKAYELRKILSKAKKATYRLGFTGTLHSNNLDNWNIKAYLGPVIRDYPSGLLAEQDYISKCIISMIEVQYLHEYDGDYHKIKDDVFNNRFRMLLIKKITDSLSHNILILVSKVEKEGDILKNALKELGTEKEIVFLSGRDNVEKRREWIENCKNRNNIILIATYQTFQQGINIPSLKYIIFGSPSKSKIRVIQSIGRSLRKHRSKKEGSKIFDIVDMTKYLRSYRKKRFNYYLKEGFDVKKTNIKEGKDFQIPQTS